MQAQAGAPTAAPSGSQLPHLGDGEDMSIADEKRLGSSIARELYRDPDYIDDPVITAYVQGIWQPLLAAAKRRGEISAEQEQLAWTVLTGRDRSINAFALPGAYFGLHLGLLAAVSTRDELASVLAHELAHASQRHLARQISRQNAQAPWLLGAMILGTIAASKNPQAASAVVTSAQAAGIQAQLNFSREMEREADRVGFALLQEAGFDPRGITGMFDKLQAVNRINDNGSFPYLRTHPLTTERLGDMQARLQLLPAAAPPDNALALQAEHALVAARARLLSDSSIDNLRTELNQAAAALRSPLPTATTPTQRIRHAVQLYGGAMAALKSRDASLAITYAQAAREALNFEAFQSLAGKEFALNAIDLIVIEAALSAQSPTAPQVQAAQAAIERLREQMHIMQRDQSLRQSPALRLLLLAQAQWAVQTLATSLERAAAIDALQTWLVAQPLDALAWQALASLYEAQGQTLRSLRALAESRVAVLDYGAALDRLKAAQDIVRSQGADHIEASILDARTRAVQALVREQQMQQLQRR